MSTLGVDVYTHPQGFKGPERAVVARSAPGVFCVQGRTGTAGMPRMWEADQEVGSATSFTFLQNRPLSHGISTATASMLRRPSPLTHA